MSIPKQALEASKKADELIKSQNEPPVEDPKKEVVEPDKVVVPDKKEPDKKEDKTIDLDTLGVEKPKEENYETKYQVLQGKYNAEVPVLYKQISELKVQLSDLQAQLKTKTETIPANMSAPKALEYLRKEMPEFEEAVNYLADMKVKEILDKRLGDVDAKMDTLGARVSQNTAASFYSYLDDNVAQWRAINNHPVFEEWLQVVNRSIGVPRLALLQDAYEKFDGPRAAAIFEDFIAEVKNKQKPKSPADRFVAPDLNGGDTTPEEKKEVTITRSDIKKFYDDVAQGMYKHNPEELKKREAEINKAIAAGAVA